MQRIERAALAGGAGAVVLTTLHETVRRLSPHAPRMDIMGMRGIERMMRAVGRRPPGRRALHPIALVGDLVSNTAYYALVRGPVAGAALGAVAGLGALVVPRYIGLGDPPKSGRRANQLMTVAWYTLGGVTAGLVQRALAQRARRASTAGSR